MLDILRHWNPELKQSINSKHVYIANYCPVCKYYNRSGRHFRFNTHLKIIKCYNCGMGAKNIQTLLHQIRNGVNSGYSNLVSHERRRDYERRKLTLERLRFEKESKCETEYESAMPF